MNAVEIEQAVSALAEAPFDATEFPYSFLEAFGNKDATLRRLRKGETNKSDLGGVLQTNNIHISVTAPGDVTKTLAALKASPATVKAKAKFVLATDGETLEADDLASGETVACNYADFPNHFGFFLPLAGITTVKQVRESAFDIRATSRLNRLYVELLKDNADWGTSERRHAMNHFMARLIFCFFAEDTDIFNGATLFTATVEQMNARDASNTHEVVSACFRAMNTKVADRPVADLPRWADAFPYVNGGLFSGSADVPRFSRIARSYLLHIGNLDWRKINPDIFGSMIQAVAEDEERGALGMHYTSVPNILKVLNPLFLDDLRSSLEAAGDNARTLLNLRKRMSKIRVFDPACGSGNFLVIAYKEMRAIEAEINRRRDEDDRRTEIPLTNFRGVELRDFPAEIARLALIIAEYQCDVLYRGQKEALQDFLPLDAQNWITCGNALRLDWLSICPPTGTGVKHHADDLFHTPLNQAQIDFENEGGETYICGNPPYKGSSYQTESQKSDLEALFAAKVKSWKNFDYVAGWFFKASEHISATSGKFAFVSTNSICQGQQVPLLWPLIFVKSQQIDFAYTSFKWSNLASHNAGVTVVIVGVSPSRAGEKKLYDLNEQGHLAIRAVDNINPYLVVGNNVVVLPLGSPLGQQASMVKGNQPSDGGNLCLSRQDVEKFNREAPDARKFIKKYLGAADYIHGFDRYCLWIEDSESADASAIPLVAERLRAVADMRRRAKAATTRPAAAWPHRFIQIQGVARRYSIIFPRISSERREFVPVGLLDDTAILSDQAFALYDAPIWNLAVGASRLHLVWVSAVCGKMETRVRYSNTLGWNAYPLPSLTEGNRADLTRCAEDILLAREAHFPATIADLYDPEKMPDDLRAAHVRNDEVLERIYIGRRFKNDTERLEKLFELYAKMSASQGTARKKAEARA
jgi:hypothetical protein